MPQDELGKLNGEEKLEVLHDTVNTLDDCLHFSVGRALKGFRPQVLQRGVILNDAGQGIRPYHPSSWAKFTDSRSVKLILVLDTTEHSLSLR